MRRTLCLGGLLLLACVPLGFAGPVDGPKYLWKRRVEKNGKLELVNEFAGGKRACVIAIGDHSPVVDLSVTVYDEKDRVVAQDQGEGQAGDFVAVFWYPPRDGTYRIVINNPGVEYNEISVALK